MSPHVASTASGVQKMVNTSHGTLDRNTLFCADFLTGWQGSLRRNKRRFIGKKKEGIWDCMRSGSGNVSGEKEGWPPGRENADTFDPSCSTNYISMMPF